MSNKAENLSIVVLGGSQGAIAALREIMRSTRLNLPAAFFIAVHLPSEAESHLPRILSRVSPLRFSHPRDRAPIRAGEVYIAPPDYHLTLEQKVVRVLKGPRENRHRPAIDPLFRTAARTFGSKTIAVLLSGNLDDGSAGMFAVSKLGGVTIAQDPGDAEAGEMPARAIEYAKPNYILPVSAIGPKLIQLIESRVKDMRSRKFSKRKQTNSAKMLRQMQSRANEHVSQNGESTGRPSVFACPECHGTLWELKEGKMTRFRCRVGHAFNLDSLKVEIDGSAETALWAAMRVLEEKAALGQRIIDKDRGTSYVNLNRLKEQVSTDRANAHRIREILLG